MVQIEKQTPANVIGFSVKGQVESRDYEHLINPTLDAHVKEHGEARLYLELIDFEGETLKALLNDLQTTVKHYGDFKKVAIAGREDWLPTAVKAGNLITLGVEVKHFGLDEKEKAMEWLR
jgi:hypothetical protein